MFDRFRQKYPQGSITSSLIQIHNDRYIVSVSIKVDGVVLATTLAADEQIQVAEAQATAQALQTLYLGESALTELPLDRQPKLELVPPILDARLNDIAKTASPIIFDEIGSIAAGTSEIIASGASAATDFGASDNIELAPQSAKNRKEKAAITAGATAIVQENAEATTYDISANLPVEPPLSVTDMIPLINMELKRLGWSREKGRDCIIELYNKRSSSLLSDEELLGLLRYLQAQPATDG